MEDGSTISFLVILAVGVSEKEQDAEKGKIMGEIKKKTERQPFEAEIEKERNNGGTQTIKDVNWARRR